ncbi:MAG: D-alanyl-D-alanine carboxypeptidase/D-alanyl-D-alanine-endopeptidase, partial [Gemmatimonadota bacterium]|nr:D-alanyl-D-alanine carboxypeptidase/D-alanyl-D-alanine-endopeptidase [Gemmatimonadota bacterium]
MNTRSYRIFTSLLFALFAGACTPSAPPAVAPAPAPTVALRTTLDSIFRDTAFAYAHWGVVVQSPKTGETLFRQNGEKMFVPASNMKLVTAAAALQALGPDYRYRTEVAATGPIRDGTLRGDLVVRGSGDPSISARFHGGDARVVFRSWADSLRARGVRRIAGRVIGVDDVFDDVPYGRGWAWDDLDAAYSAPISGLSFNDNMVRVRVQPARQAGTVASVAVDPDVGYLRPTGQVQTAAAGTRSALSVTRDVGAPGVVATGTIAADTSWIEETIAVPDPTQFFVTALRETLRQAGIEVSGVAVDADRLAAAGETLVPTMPLFAHHSPPMREILPHFMKPSQNQIGEILLKTLGRERRGTGSYPAGRAVVDSLVRVWGLNPRQLSMADGSGLSRYNLVAPDLLLGLLQYMSASPHFDVWYASLPVAGVDGTLTSRLRGTPAERNVHA